MTKLLIPLAALAASFSLLAAPASAGVCGPRDTITKQLGAKFKEARRGIGLASPATVIELFVSEEGTWTLFATDTRGLSCVIGAGEAWQDQPKILAGLDS